MIGGWVGVLSGLMAITLGAQTPALSLAACGLVGDGRHDDTAAFQQALETARGRRLEGRPGAVYRITAALRMPEEVDLDLGGAHLQLVGTLGIPFRRATSEPPPLALSEPPRAGERTLDLASPPPAALQVGGWITLATEALAGRFPPAYAQVVRIAGSRVWVDRPFPLDLPGPVRAVPIQRKGRFRLVHGTIDGSGADPVVQAVWLQGYAQVTWEDVALTGLRGGETNLLLIQDCLEVTVRRCKLTGFSLVVSGEAINVWNARKVTIEGNAVDGEGFGIAAVRCDEVAIRGNTLLGRAQQRRQTSVRGVKVIGCQGALIQHNRIENYVTAVKSEDSGGTRILENQCLTTAPGDLTSFAIGASNQHPDPRYHGDLRIEGNTIRVCGGIGIFVDAGSPRTRILGNHLEGLGASGIYVAAGQGHIEGNDIRRAGQARPSPAIQATRSSRVVDNSPRGPGGDALAASALEEPKP
jgi:hypothetical protein